MNTNQLERLISAVEKIADRGIDIYLKADETSSSEKMALDLASMKVNDGLREIASALDGIANKTEG